MEKLVAVAIRTDTGVESYFLTWGRLHHAVDPRPLVHAVLSVADKFSIGGAPQSGRLCVSLQEAAGATYFYEQYFEMTLEVIPTSPSDYSAWKRGKMASITEGSDIFFAGRARRAPEHPAAADVTLGDGYVPPVARHEPPVGFSSPPSFMGTMWAEDELQCHIWLWEIKEWSPSPTGIRPKRLCEHCTLEPMGDLHQVCTVCGHTLGPTLSDMPAPPSEAPVSEGAAPVSLDPANGAPLSPPMEAMPPMEPAVAPMPPPPSWPPMGAPDPSMMPPPLAPPPPPSPWGSSN